MLKLYTNGIVSVVLNNHGQTKYALFVIALLKCLVLRKGSIDSAECMHA